VREFGDQKDAAAEAKGRLSAAGSAKTPSRLTGRLLWSAPRTGGANPDSVSTDGRFATFTDGQSGELAIHDFATNTDHRLTNIGGWSVGYTAFSSVSPDEKHIAYAAYLDKENALELRVSPISAAETAPPKVALRTSQDDGIYAIGWLPDGK